MLTLRNWKDFLIRYVEGIFIFFVPLILTSIFFCSNLVYLGADTSSLFLLIVRSEPYLVFYSVVKVLTVSILIFVGLNFISLALTRLYKIIFGFIFFFSAIVRLMSLYPALTQKWFIVSRFHSVFHFIQYLSLLPEHSKLRTFINWLPFLCCAFVFILNFFFYMKNLLRLDRLVQKARNSIYVDEFDKSSKIFSIQGLSFFIFLVGGGIFLAFLNSSLSSSLPQNNTNTTRPHVFILASDSLRADRLFKEEYAQVMPFLREKLAQSTLFKPMLVGVPRTFPSWVEIASGNYALSTGVRSMFPSRSARQGKKKTIFELARQSGYSTLFVSDFAGDIFPRYPFGGSIVDAPTSNLSTLIENGIIGEFTALQAVLILPSLQRMIPALLESPEIADPRLVVNAVAKDLAQVSSLPDPVFLTVFFSSAHFPYAAPGPWYGKFQNPSPDQDYSFQKNPDQSLTNHNPSLLNHPSVQKKQQAIALYNGGLNAIDNSLSYLFSELEKKGWLDNSIVLIFGDHGENLYDGDMGMGHGDGVAGEYSSVTPLVILTHGNARPFQTDISTMPFVRTVDIAPTLAKRLGLNFDYEKSDGVPLLDKGTARPQFSQENAYMETGIWFTSALLTPEGKPRLNYPSVTALLDIDAGMNFEFYLRPAYYQTIPGVKERAWIDNNYRLIVRTTKIGTQLSLYARSDKDALNNLLISQPKTKKIAQKMLIQLNNYLISHGVEIIKNQDNSFFYAENIAQ